MTSELKKKPEKIRKNRPGAGRPIKTLDEQTVLHLASLGCNCAIIAGCFGVDETTVENKYSGIIKNGRFHLKKNLLAVLYDKAVNKGDTTCLIWLSKQYLGFKEPKQEIEQKAEGNFTIYIMDYASNSKKCQQT